MKATTLMGCVVRDNAGEVIGHVHDLRLEEIAADGASDEVDYQLTGLLCGGAAIGHRLGYGNGDMAGPWAVLRFVRWACRRSVLVEWRDVERLEVPDIYIGRRRSDLAAAAPRDRR